MTHIIRHKKITPSELAELMKTRKRAVIQQLVKLEKDRYILRKRDEADGGIFVIELAEKGLQYKKEMAAFNADISIILSAITLGLSFFVYRARPMELEK